jgi:hypothetical protein
VGGGGEEVGGGGSAVCSTSPGQPRLVPEAGQSLVGNGMGGGPTRSATFLRILRKIPGIGGTQLHPTIGGNIMGVTEVWGRGETLVPLLATA